MKKKIFFVFVAYVWAKLSLKLIIYPYESVREVTRNNIFLPVLLSPLYGLILLLIVGRIASFFLEISTVKRELIAFALSSGLISILFWQSLLLYLFFTFFLALKSK